MTTASPSATITRTSQCNLCQKPFSFPILVTNENEIAVIPETCPDCYWKHTGGRGPENTLLTV